MNSNNPTGDESKDEKTGEVTGTPPATQGEEKKFTQAEVNRMLADERRKDDEKRKRATDEAAAKAREEELTKQQEFQRLADERAQRIAKLESENAELAKSGERATALEAALKAQLDAQLKDVPDHIKPLLAKMDVHEQISYLAENRDKLISGGQRKQISPTPDGDSAKNLTDAEKDARRKQFAAQTRGMYS